MKTLHLVCAAHLDPVWMWDWDEGADAALATFYSAVELSGEYDYIFCHNEAVLYEYIERYAPELFKKIQALVKSGKWHIMGGWYLQPDCTIPSGETFLRQISVGHEYFESKFNTRVTTAANFDSFGHTRGLVQILKKSGYDSYLFCRPMKEFLPLPANPFVWEGYDGSTIKALRIEDSNLYTNALGNAKNEILRKAGPFFSQDVGLALWGVGNHGGGPSRKDLSDILELMDEKKGEYRIIHSTPEAYFASVKPTVTYAGSLLPCFIKTYSSISEVKQKQAQFETALFKTEKACSAASLAGVYAYPREVFHQAEKSLCAMDFHDILSGTCIEKGLRSTLRRSDAALEALNDEFLNAFHALAETFPAAKEGDNPLAIYSFQPYPRKCLVETEMLLPQAIVSDSEGYALDLYQEGKKIPSQVIKEDANINYDRRKRILYEAELDPLAVSEVVVRYHTAKKESRLSDDGQDLSFDFGSRQLHLNRQSGLLDSYVYEGKEYLSGGAFLPVMFDDNADPWGWYLKKLGTNLTPFSLSEKAKEGPFAGISAVNLLEKGPLLTEVECLFSLRASFVRVVYKIYPTAPYIDVDVDVLWNEEKRGLKLLLPLREKGGYFAQEAYGSEEWKADGAENVGQRFVGVEENGNALVVYNNGTYCSAKDEEKLYLTLLNGSAYCAHPIGERPILDETHFNTFIEQGRHHFSFRLAVNERKECERLADEFMAQPYSVNRYPHGQKALVPDLLFISDPNLVLTSFRMRKDGGYLLRIFHNDASSAEGDVRLLSSQLHLHFGAYEFKTLSFEKGTLRIEEDAAAY
jgi:alpha-mannosidase